MRNEGRDEPKLYRDLGNSLKQNTQTGVIYVRKTFRRYRIPDLFTSTRTDKVGKARAEADLLIKQHLDRYLGGGSTLKGKRDGTLFADVVDQVYEEKMPLKRKRTAENYRLYLEELKREWRGWTIERITPTEFHVWLKEFRRRKNRKTFNDYAVYMNLCLRFAYEKRLTPHLTVIPLTDGVRPQAGRVYSPKEIKALWAVMNEETRDQFILGYECFMRLREALFLTWDRVNLKTGEITLRAEDVKTGSRTGKGRSFIASPGALKRLQARRKLVKHSDYVFPSPKDETRPVNQNKTAWREAKTKAGVKLRARWHDIRHTALTEALLVKKIEPILVSEYSGVSLRTIQRVYLHSTAEKTRKVAGSLKI